MASKKSAVKKAVVTSKNEPPIAYQNFVHRFPGLAKAWDATSNAGASGPFSEKQIRLIKLAIAVGAMREGAIRSSVRKAVAMGVTQKELDQVVSLAAGTLGFPSTVAVFSWMESAQKRS
jgi:alkylhydroperoxidase/carboxymuconolactone decarboxylase family protein YurZ